MKSLYARLADRWEDLFPPDSERASFVSGLLAAENGLPEALPVVEVACGTGATARHLAGRGYAVAATDLDPVMIEAAERAASAEPHPAARPPDFQVADMVATLKERPAVSASAVLCLGSSLPYLGRPEAVAEFLNEASRILAPGGYLVIQILDFSSILRESERRLPDLETDDLIFERTYIPRPGDGTVVFETRVRSGNTVEERRDVLWPAEPERLDVMAAAAGFRSRGLRGDWSGRRFRDGDPWMVAVYRREEVRA